MDGVFFFSFVVLPLVILLVIGLASLGASLQDGSWRVFWRSDPWIIEHTPAYHFYRVYKKMCKPLYALDGICRTMDEAVSYVKKKTQVPKNKNTVHGYEEIVAQIELNELTGKE